MRRFCLFFAVIFSVIAHAQGNEMVVPGNFWIFSYGYDEATFIVTNNKKSVNNNTYYEVERTLFSKDSMAKGMMHSGPFVSSRASKFWLREAEGKVYSLKDDYINVMKETYETEMTDVYLEENGDIEVLLYDFTLDVGHRYPCKNDVTVATVEEMTTRDGIVRRMLHLSNGLILIEGIGCINSWGEIFGYQNFDPAANANGSVYNSVLSRFSLDEIIIYCKGDETLSLSSPKTHEIKSITKNIYDLSGRRVANSSEFQGSSFKLPKGVYIQGGKKFVVK